MIKHRCFGGQEQAKVGYIQNKIVLLGGRNSEVLRHPNVTRVQIEITCTLAIFVICSKINPKLDGVPIKYFPEHKSSCNCVILRGSISVKPCDIR